MPPLTERADAHEWVGRGVKRAPVFTLHFIVFKNPVNTTSFWKASKFYWISED